MDALDLISLKDMSNINISPYVDLQQIVENNQKNFTHHH